MYCWLSTAAARWIAKIVYILKFFPLRFMISDFEFGARSTATGPMRIAFTMKEWIFVCSVHSFRSIAHRWRGMSSRSHMAPVETVHLVNDWGRSLSMWLIRIFLRSKKIIIVRLIWLYTQTSWQKNNTHSINKYIYIKFLLYKEEEAVRKKRNR